MIAYDAIGESQPESFGGSVLLRELRCVDRSARNDIARREEVKDARRGVGCRTQRRRVTGGYIVAALSIDVGETQSAKDTGEVKDRLAQVATLRGWSGIACAGLRIIQDSRDHRLHIAADTGAVVGKYSRDAANVRG